MPDNLIHGRTCGRHWFIWCSFSGICNRFIWTSNLPFMTLQLVVVLLRLLIFCLMQAKCLETGEAVAIKKVLQDKRYKNRELQIMRLLDHPNVVQLKHCFFSTTDKDELYLNLVLEYVPETVYRVARHYSRMNQHIPILHVQLYAYQVYCVDCKIVWVVYFVLLLMVLPVWVSLLSSKPNSCVIPVDLSCACLHTWCHWCMSSGYQTTKFIGKLLFHSIPFFSKILLWVFGFQKT